MKTLEWTQPPAKELGNVLHETMDGLEDEVLDMPRMEDVIGIPVEQLTAHAVEAIATFRGDEESKTEFTLDDLISVYSMGFIVGVRYQQRAKAAK